MDLNDFTNRGWDSKPVLTEPGVKYFLSQTLKQWIQIRAKMRIRLQDQKMNADTDSHSCSSHYLILSEVARVRAASTVWTAAVASSSKQRPAGRFGRVDAVACDQSRM